MKPKIYFNNMGDYPTMKHVVVGMQLELAVKKALD